MSNTQFEAELKQFRTKLNLLVKEAQALFLRHSNSSPHAALSVMPHLETARQGVEQVLTPPNKKPARLMESGD